MRIIAATIITLLFAGQSFASTLIEIAPGGTNDNAYSLADTYDHFELDDVLGTSVIGNAACDFGNSTTCTFDLVDGVEFVTVKANGFEALFGIMAGDNSLVVDVSTWEDSGADGVAGWNRKWPNGGGGYPAISNVRQWGTNAVPEPSAALVFCVGVLIVQSRVRRQS
jgi:hypothetical protein